MPEHLTHLLMHSFLDALKMLPFLFVAYLVLEFIEHRSSSKLEKVLGSGKLGVVGGALLGCLPQCGFSVVASNFYAGRVISLGTLAAVFLVTSDEAVVLMLAHPESYPMLLTLLGVKLAVGLAAGFGIDAAFRRFGRRKEEGAGEAIHDLCGQEHCHCEHGIWLSALRHAVSLFLFLFVVLFALEFCVEWIGEERLASLLLEGSVFQPFAAALVGFIPNCAGSVLLTELYLAGGISFGSAVAGLCTGAGIGWLVLWRVNRRWKENLCFMAVLYGVAVAVGLLLQLFF